jgi:transposase InsO family protein
VNCYSFIEAEKALYRSVKRACELLGVSRAAYYAARAGQPSGRDREDVELTARITAGHKRSKGRYGAARIHAELRRQGRRHSVSGSPGRCARPGWPGGRRGGGRRPPSRTRPPRPADSIRRDFTADASKINQRWCGDITYIVTWEGWLYLATVIDIAPAAMKASTCSRRMLATVVGMPLRTRNAARSAPSSV